MVKSIMNKKCFTVHQHNVLNVVVFDKQVSKAGTSPKQWRRVLMSSANDRGATDGEKESRDLRIAKRVLAFAFNEDVANVTTLFDPSTRFVQYDTDGGARGHGGDGHSQPMIDEFGDDNRIVRHGNETSLSLTRAAVMLNERVPQSQAASHMWARALHAARSYEKICEMDVTMRDARPRHHEYVRWLRSYRVPVVVVRRNATAHLTWVPQTAQSNTVHFGDSLPSMPHAEHGAFASDKSTANALLYEVVYLDMLGMVALALHALAHPGAMVEWGADGTMPSCDEFDRVPDANGRVFRWNERAAEAARNVGSRQDATPRSYVREHFSESRVRVFDTCVRFDEALALASQSTTMDERRRRQEHVVAMIRDRSRQRLAEEELAALRMAEAIVFEHDPDVPVGDLGGPSSAALRFESTYMHFATLTEEPLRPRDAYAKARELLSGAGGGSDTKDAEWNALVPSFDDVCRFMGADTGRLQSVYAFVSACTTVMIERGGALILPSCARVRTLNAWLARYRRHQRSSPNFRAFAAELIERVDAWLVKVVRAVECAHGCDDDAWGRVEALFPEILVRRSLEELTDDVDDVALRCAAPSRRLWQHMPQHDARVQNIFTEASEGRSTYVESPDRLQYDDAFVDGDACTDAPVRNEHDELDHELHRRALHESRIDAVRDHVNPLALSRHFRTHVFPLAGTSAALLGASVAREDAHVGVALDSDDTAAADRLAAWHRHVRNHGNGGAASDSDVSDTSVLLDQLVTIVAEPFCEGRELRTEQPGVRNRVDTSLSHERFEDSVVRLADNNVYWRFFGHVARLLLGGEAPSVHDFQRVVDGNKVYEKDKKKKDAQVAEENAQSVARCNEIYAFVARVATSYRTLYAAELPDGGDTSATAALVSGLRLRDGARLLGERLALAETILCRVPWLRRPKLLKSLGDRHVFSSLYDYGVNAVLTERPRLNVFNALLTERARRQAMSTSWARTATNVLRVIADGEARRRRRQEQEVKGSVLQSLSADESALVREMLRDEPTSLLQLNHVTRLDLSASAVLLQHEPEAPAWRLLLGAMVVRVPQLHVLGLPVHACDPHASFARFGVLLDAITPRTELVIAVHDGGLFNVANDRRRKIPTSVESIRIVFTPDPDTSLCNISEWFDDAACVRHLALAAPNHVRLAPLPRLPATTRVAPQALPLDIITEFCIVHTHWSHFARVERLGVHNFAYTDGLALALAIDSAMLPSYTRASRHRTTDSCVRVERDLCVSEHVTHALASDRAFDVAALRVMHERALARGFVPVVEGNALRHGDAYITPCGSESLRRRRVTMCVGTWRRTAAWLADQQRKHRVTLGLLEEFLHEWRRRASAMRLYEMQPDRSGLAAPAPLPSAIGAYVWRRNDVLAYLSRCASVPNFVETLERLEWHWATDATGVDPLGAALWSNRAQVVRALGEYNEPLLSFIDQRDARGDMENEGVYRFYEGCVRHLLRLHRRYQRLGK